MELLKEGQITGKYCSSDLWRKEGREEGREGERGGKRRGKKGEPVCIPYVVAIQGPQRPE